jgi:Fic family protein
VSLPIETPSRIEPCLLEQTSPVIVDLVASLSSASSRLGTRLHPRSAASLADAVRIMNCYYSNLIEGHNTSLREIERAMAGQLDTTEERRNLQVEARAHIRVQRDIDRRFALDDLFEPASVDFIRGLYQSD